MRFKVVMSVALAFLLSATVLFAQGTQTGILRGTVTTADKLSLPGATVTIKSPAMQGARTAVTEADGTFLFRGIPPGVYTITFEMSGMGTVTKTANVLLGNVSVVDMVMDIAKVQETVQVTAEAPTVLTTPTVGANVRHEQVEALATRRDLEGIANIAPAVTESTAPNASQLNINGAFAYDNMFMINGVDVNDNLFGSPQNVFIEDAIQETQVLTSGITAEYGRFSGGVVNAITKSGSNLFSGSFRMNLANPTWSTLTPYETKNNITRTNVLNKTYEATFGGPVAKDKLWFFTAGRYANTTASNTFQATGIKYDTTTNNKRGELKLTGSPAANQTIQVNYITNPTTDGPRGALGGYEIDPSTLITRQTPNNIFGANWRGVLRSDLFAEVGYSQRHFSFVNAGGTSTAMVDSPYFTLTQAGGNYEYNAPYFDANDPEDRNNRQLTANLSYSMSKAGRHDFKGGWEWYRSTRTGGNSQSATGYVYYADFVTNAAGDPVLDSNSRPIPIFESGNAIQEHWIPTIGAKLDTDTHSFFIQDHWVPARTLSFDLGLRYEKVKSQATGGIIGVDTNTLVPRLAAAFDPKGDGKTVFHVTYAHYSGRYNDAQIGANSAVGNPAYTDAIYVGPTGQGRDFAPGLDPKNYEIYYGSFPTANIFMAPGLSSPITKEFTVSGGTGLGNKGSMQVTYVWRKVTNFIEDFINLDNGTTHVVQNGVDFGTFTNVMYRNTNVPLRGYQGLVFQADYRLTPNWQVAGNYTLQLKNDGNFAGEGQNTPGTSSAYGDFPVNTLPGSVYERSYPDGRLYDYQQSKLRLWTIYMFNLNRYGRLSASGMLRADSGLTYSLAATRVPFTSQQIALMEAAGYPEAATADGMSQTVYFGERGSQFFAGYALVDASFNYEIPVFKSARPWLKFDIYNLLDNQKLISWNTTVSPNYSGALDAYGLPLDYKTGKLYGQATSTANYPRPFQGQPGGRTFRVAFGLRF